MKQRAKFWAAAAVLAAAAAAVIIFFCTDISFSPDQTCNALIEDIIPRAALSAAFIALALLCGFSQPFTLKTENFARADENNSFFAAPYACMFPKKSR